jgi:hypothetical protein
LGWKILIKSDNLQAQEEYRRKQDALRRQSAQGTGESVSLTDLEFYPYLTEDGHITDLTQPGVKASLYAIYDENKILCYIGVSRQVSRFLLPWFLLIASMWADVHPNAFGYFGIEKKWM